MDFLKVTLGSALIFSFLGLSGVVTLGHGHGWALADDKAHRGPTAQVRESEEARARLRVLNQIVQSGLHVRDITDNSVLETMLKGGLKECEKVYGTDSGEAIQARFAILRLYQEQRRWSESQPFLKTQIEAFSKLKPKEQLPLAQRYLQEARTYLGRARWEDAALLTGVVFGLLEQKPQLILDRQFLAPLQDCSRLLEARQKWSEAEELHRHMLAVLNKCQPVDEQALAFEELALSKILLAERRFSAAQEFAQLAGQRTGGNSFAALLIESKIFLEQGKLEEAAALLGKIEAAWRPGGKIEAPSFAAGFFQPYQVERQELDMLAAKFISGDDFKSATRLWLLMLEKAREKPSDLLGILDGVYRQQPGVSIRGGNVELETFYNEVLAKYPSLQVQEKVAQNKAWMYISLRDCEKFIAAFKSLIKLSVAASVDDDVPAARAREASSMSTSRGIAGAGKFANLTRILDSAGSILTAGQYHDLALLLLKESSGLSSEAKARVLAKICALYLKEPVDLVNARRVFLKENNLFRSSIKSTDYDLAASCEKLFTLYLQMKKYREAADLASSMANYGFNENLQISVVNGYLQVGRMYESVGDPVIAEKLVRKALLVIESTKGRDSRSYRNALSSQVRLLRLQGLVKKADLAEQEAAKLEEKLKDQAFGDSCD